MNIVSSDFEIRQRDHPFNIDVMRMLRDDSRKWARDGWIMFSQDSNSRTRVTVACGIRRCQEMRCDRSNNKHQKQTRTMKFDTNMDEPTALTISKLKKNVRTIISCTNRMKHPQMLMAVTLGTTIPTVRHVVPICPPPGCLSRAAQAEYVRNTMNIPIPLHLGWMRLIGITLNIKITSINIDQSPWPTLRSTQKLRQLGTTEMIHAGVNIILDKDMGIKRKASKLGCLFGSHVTAFAESWCLATRRYEHMCTTKQMRANDITSVLGHVLIPCKNLTITPLLEEFCHNHNDPYPCEMGMFLLGYLRSNPPEFESISMCVGFADIVGRVVYRNGLGATICRANHQASSGLRIIDSPALPLRKICEMEPDSALRVIELAVCANNQSALMQLADDTMTMKRLIRRVAAAQASATNVADADTNHANHIDMFLAPFVSSGAMQSRSLLGNDESKIRIFKHLSADDTAWGCKADELQRRNRSPCSVCGASTKYNAPCEHSLCLNCMSRVWSCPMCRAGLFVKL